MLPKIVDNERLLIFHFTKVGVQLDITLLHCDDFDSFQFKR